MPPDYMTVGTSSDDSNREEEVTCKSLDGYPVRVRGTVPWSAPRKVRTGQKD
jgi:hypothetical protein